MVQSIKKIMNYWQFELLLILAGLNLINVM